MRLVLTDSQAELVQEILDAQNSCKVGFIAVLNFGFDRLTGERIVQLEFVGLPWADAAKVCRLARKLAEQEKSAGGEPTLPRNKTLTGPQPTHAGQPFA
jgi:hypothetical protein